MNFVRRGLYGLFIVPWSIHGHAAQPPKDPRPKTLPTPTHFVPWQFSGDQAPLHVSLLEQSHALGHHPHKPMWPPHDESALFSARFNMDAAHLASGFDVDLNLAGFASLHLMLDSDPQTAKVGRRWAVTTSDSDALRRSGKSCSLTAALDFVRMAPYGEHRMVFFPELHFALDTMLGAPKGMAASMRYSQWLAGPEDRGALDARVPQLLVSWSF